MSDNQDQGVTSLLEKVKKETDALRAAIQASNQAFHEHVKNFPGLRIKGFVFHEELKPVVSSEIRGIVGATGDDNCQKYCTGKDSEGHPIVFCCQP
jgi:hypothetical protein